MLRTHAPARAAPGLRVLVPHPWLRARRDPLGFLMEGLHRYGDVFRYQVGPFGPFLFHQVAHPDHIRHVLQDRWRNYPRSFFYNRTKEAIGNGLVSSEGEPWRWQRRMCQPAFHHARVEALAGMMTDATELMLRRWEPHASDPGNAAPLDIYPELMRLTLSIAGRTLFGVDLGEDADVIGPAITGLMEWLTYRLNTALSLPAAVPTVRSMRFRRDRRTLESFVYGIINERRSARAGQSGAGVADRGDLLSMLMLARDEETGQALSDVQLRDQVITFIGAGHETTAVALTWTFYLLSRHPDAERRVREEVEQVLSGRTPTAADVPRLRYIRQVIEESMRLYPPVYALLRDAVEADEIGGYPIPAGSIIILSQYVTHRHPAFWDAPVDAFDPGRFSPERVAARPKFAFFPFLGGPHQCIGQDFAMMEMAMVVAMVLQRYTLRPAAPGPVEILPLLSLRPRGGMPMSLHARAG
jgi:cytochrome P450